MHHTTALFLSSCIIMDIAVKVQERIDMLSKSNTRLSAIDVPREKVSTVKAVEYGRLSN